jgi:hypothetical protein
MTIKLLPKGMQCRRLSQRGGRYIPSPTPSIARSRTVWTPLFQLTLSNMDKSQTIRVPQLPTDATPFSFISQGLGGASLVFSCTNFFPYLQAHYEVSKRRGWHEIISWFSTIFHFLLHFSLSFCEKVRLISNSDCLYTKSLLGTLNFRDSVLVPRIFCLTRARFTK